MVDIVNRLGNIFNPGTLANSSTGKLIQQDVQRRRSGQSDMVTDTENELKSAVQDIDSQVASGNFDPGLTGFSSAEEYKTWREGFDVNDVNASDFLKVYGKEQGITRWNRMGFGQSLFGLDTQFDPFESQIDFDAEVFGPMLRKADTGRQAFVTVGLDFGQADTSDAGAYGRTTKLTPDTPDLDMAGAGFDAVDEIYKSYKLRLDPKKEFVKGNFGQFADNLSKSQNWFSPRMAEEIGELLSGDTLLNPVIEETTTPGATPPANMQRSDGTQKSNRGFLGGIRNNVTGGTMTELSIGVEIDGKETQIPALVPTLTEEEIGILQNNDFEGRASEIPESIKEKAKKHAEGRIAAGKSPFYGAGPDNIVTITDEQSALNFINKITKSEGQVTGRIRETGFKSLTTTYQLDPLYRGKDRIEGIENVVVDKNTHPFDMEDDAWNSLSFNTQEQLLTLEKAVSKENANRAFGKDFNQKFNDATRGLRGTPGAADEAKAVGEVRRFLTNNKDKLLEAFAEDSNLYADFQKNPYAFGRAYIQNQGALFGTEVSAADESTIKRTEIAQKLDDDTRQRIMGTIANNDIRGFITEMTALSKDVRLSDEAQNQFVGIIQKYNNDFRGLKNKQDRIILAGTFIAGLDPSTAAKVMPNMFTFIESGKFDLKQDQLTQDYAQLALQQDRLTFDETKRRDDLEKDSRTVTPIGDEARKLLTEINQIGANKKQLLEKGAEVRNILESAIESGNRANISQAARTVNLFMKNYINSIAGSGILRNSVLGFLVSDPSQSVLDIRADIAAFDKNGKRVTDINKSNDVAYVRSKSAVDDDRLVGKKIQQQTVDSELGEYGAELLFILSQLPDEQVVQLLGGQ